jgi:hypothetical protein
MRAIIKPMPGYAAYNLVGVRIPADGREFIVDDKAVEKFEPTAALEAVDKSDLDDDRKAQVRREIIGTCKGGFCDAPGQPLILSSKAYAYVKGLIGSAVIVEPIGGDGVAAAAQISEKDAEIAELRQKLAALEGSTPKASPPAKKPA